MAKFAVAFETMKNFHKIHGKETLDELVLYSLSIFIHVHTLQKLEVKVVFAFSCTDTCETACLL